MTEPRRYRTQYGAGKVHLARPSERFRSYTILYCTGRAVEGAFTTGEAEECKACLKRARREGIEP